MKLNWIFLSLGAGLIAGIIAYVWTSHALISLLIGIAVTVIVLLYNPKRRYMKAFWVLLSMLLVLNRFFFEVVGKVSDIDFKVGSNEPGDIVSVTLLILAGFALLLDFFERNGKLDGTFLQVNKNLNKKVSGNNIHIHQHINESPQKTQDDK